MREARVCKIADFAEELIENDDGPEGIVTVIEAGGSDYLSWLTSETRR